MTAGISHADVQNGLCCLSSDSVQAVFLLFNTHLSLTQELLTLSSVECGNTSYSDNPSQEALAFHRRDFLQLDIKSHLSAGVIQDLKDVEIDDKEEVRHFKHTHVTNISESGCLQDEDLEKMETLITPGSTKIRTRHKRNMSGIGCRVIKHEWELIKSLNRVLSWNCGYCHSGPHWFVQECIHCRLKACHMCSRK